MRHDAATWESTLLVGNLFEKFRENENLFNLIKKFLLLQNNSETKNIFLENTIFQKP